MKGDDERQEKPVEYPMPESIPDTPENIARAILTTPPKKEKEWRYTQDRDGESD